MAPAVGTIKISNCGTSVTSLPAMVYVQEISVPPENKKCSNIRTPAVVALVVSIYPGLT